MARRDPMVLVPSVVLGLITAIAKLWGPQFFVPSATVSNRVILTLLVVLVSSEMVRYITISWAVQLSQTRSVDVRPSDFLATLVIAFHLLLMLSAVAVVGGGLALLVVVSPQSQIVMFPALIVGIGIGLIALIASNFIIIESLPAWRALTASVRMIQQSFGILIRVMTVSIVVAFVFGVLGETLDQLPGIGIALSGIVAGVGSGISVLVQTIGFLDIRSRYRSVQ